MEKLLILVVAAAVICAAHWLIKAWICAVDKSIAESFRSDYDELYRRRHRINERSAALGWPMPYSGKRLGLDDYYDLIGAEPPELVARSAG